MNANSFDSLLARTKLDLLQRRTGPTSTMCTTPGCSELTGRRFCPAHAATARCSAEDCSKRPSFGIEGQGARFCSIHKLDDMVDVVNRKCEHGVCMKRPIFGVDGDRARFCGAHKLAGMVDVVYMSRD